MNDPNPGSVAVAYLTLILDGQYDEANQVLLEADAMTVILVCAALAGCLQGMLKQIARPLGIEHDELRDQLLRNLGLMFANFGS